MCDIYVDLPFGVVVPVLDVRRRTVPTAAAHVLHVSQLHGLINNSLTSKGSILSRFLSLKEFEGHFVGRKSVSKSNTSS